MTHAPTKLTPERHKAIVEGLRAGNFVTAVCRASAIRTQTYYRWREQGEKLLGEGDISDIPADEPHRIYAQFFLDTEVALGHAEMKAVRVLEKAAEEGEYRAAETYLKRRFRTRWGDSEHVTQETQVHVKSVKITDEKGKTVDPFGPAAGEGKDA